MSMSLCQWSIEITGSSFVHCLDLSFVFCIELVLGGDVVPKIVLIDIRYPPTHLMIR